ncbi:MAG: Ig-like domain-containing protein [Gemmatimonadales bacterium]|nr:Ig-like domain-containing protein [Gemmatimonadales bacterium]
MLAAALAAAPARAQALAEITVTPEAMTLQVGGRDRVLAAGFDRQGNLVSASKAKFTFSSADTLVATVTPEGLVTAHRPGSTMIAARSGSRAATVQVTVKGDPSAAPPVAAAPAPRPAAVATPAPAAPAVSMIAVEPAAIRLLPLETARLAARELKADGSTGIEVPVQWRSINPTIATIDASGIVRGLQAGTAVILAEIGVAPNQVTAAAQVVVETVDVALSSTDFGLEVDASETLALVVPSQKGRPVNVRLSWASTDERVARVTPLGQVTAVGPGKAEIVATYLRDYRAAVTVYPKVAEVRRRPPTREPVVVPLLGTAEVRLTPIAADESEIPGVKIGWTLSDSSVASYDQAKGLLTGKAVGSTKLTALLRGFDPLVWTVNVVPSAIVLDRPRLGLGVGGTAKLAASLADDTGKPIGALQQATWASSRAEVATVGADGAVTAVGMGKAVITATSPWGKSGSAELFVMGDLLWSSSRDKGFSVYHAQSSAPGQPQRLAGGDGFSMVQARPSPDRTRIAYSANLAGPSYDIFVADADGGRVERLTNGAGSNSDPVWTPDGKQILFTSSRAGPSQVFIMNADGSEQKALTTSERGNLQAMPSPDGKSIAFVSVRDGGYELYVMDRSGENQRRLTQTREKEQLPHWTPSGEIIVAQEGIASGATSTIVRINPATGQRTPLFETKHLLQGLAVNRDATLAAVVEARISGARQEYFFSLRSLTGTGAVPVPLPLQPGETVTSPSF